MDLIVRRTRDIRERYTAGAIGFYMAAYSAGSVIATLLLYPVVAMFGPTAPLHYGPGGPIDLVFYRDLYCSPCLTNYNLKISRCVDPVCMRGITPAEVLAAAQAGEPGKENAPVEPVHSQMARPHLLRRPCRAR
jgi:hypothetical protein